MGSIMDSRYWTCRSCCQQFDWESATNRPEDHDEKKCAAQQKADREWREQREKAASQTQKKS